MDVEEYVSLEKFEKYRQVGLKKGFRFIASSPLARSLYKAAEAITALFYLILILKQWWRV